VGHQICRSIINKVRSERDSLTPTAESASMKRFGFLGIFLALFSIVLSHPSLSQQNMTESQNAILRQTLAANGSISRAMHNSFWADAPKSNIGEFDRAFIWLLDSAKIAQIYQRALWQSALFSYEQKEIVRTEALGESERAIKEFNLKNAPFKEGSKDYDDFVNAYAARTKISDENARRLLEAAARHSELKAVNGEVVIIDDALIRTVLDQMDASFGRLKLLINPVWKGN
jgi:hypothetical protein